MEKKEDKEARLTLELEHEHKHDNKHDWGTDPVLPSNPPSTILKICES
jgi:hypothetical protein